MVFIKRLDDIIALRHQQMQFARLQTLVGYFCGLVISRCWQYSRMLIENWIWPNMVTL